MNIIIVGLGSIGKHYLQLIPKISKKSKIYFIDKIKMDINKKFIRTSFEEIKKKNILFDYAIICSPSGLHFKHSYFFINRGVNTLIEKPFVLNLNHANLLIKLSKKKKVKCWTVLQNRYNLAVQKLKEEINKKKIGKISFVDCVMFWHRDLKYYSNGWRGKYKSDGGVLTNQAIHLLDMLVYIFGPINYFDAFASFNKKKLQAEDLILINFKHRNGVLSSFKATTRADRDYRTAIDVIGKKGRLIIKGIALNSFNKFTKNHIKEYKKNSEIFLDGKGKGHIKVLREFFSKKMKSSKNLEIYNNLYILKIIHSIYNLIDKRKKFNLIKNKNSKLGL